MEKVLKTWLARQCRMLQGCRRAVLVAGKPRKATFKQAFFWPDANYDYGVLTRFARVALRNNKTVIKTLRNQGKNSDLSLDVLASPVFLKDTLSGAVVIVMAHRSLALQNAAVQQVQTGIRWLEAMTELSPDSPQAAGSKLFGLRSPWLSTAAGLAVILLVGLLLVMPLIWIPSGSETQSVDRRSIVLPRKAETAAAHHVAAGKPEIDVASGMPERTHGAGTGRRAGDPERDAATQTITVGPIVNEARLKRAAQILQSNGFRFRQSSGMGTVKVVRLLEGLYSRAHVRERFKTVQNVVDSAFIVKEGDQRAIYVATYRDRAKAAQRIEKLAEKGIHVTAVDTALTVKGPVLVIPNGTQSQIETVADRMSALGLSVQAGRSE